MPVRMNTDGLILDPTLVPDEVLVSFRDADMVTLVVGPYDANKGGDMSVLGSQGIDIVELPVNNVPERAQRGVDRNGNNVLTYTTPSHDDDAALFQVHKEQLVRVSKYFRRILRPERKEFIEKKVYLTDYTPEIVDRFVQWCYCGKYSMPNPNNEPQRYIRILCELHIFADKIEALTLKTNVFRRFGQMAGHTNAVPWAEMIEFVYEKTPRHSALRKLLVLWYGFHIDYDWYDRAEFPDWWYSIPDFTADLTTVLGRRVRYPNWVSPLKNSDDILWKDPDGPLATKPSTSGDSKKKKGNNKKRSSDAAPKGNKKR